MIRSRVTKLLQRQLLGLLLSGLSPIVSANSEIEVLSNQFQQTGEVTLELANKVRQLADEGNTDAMLVLAEIADLGLGMPSENQELAFNWYLSAARDGNSTAALEVAIRYLQTKGTPAENDLGLNIARGVYWLNQSANALNPEAIYLLSQAYLKGELFEQDLNLSKNKDNALELLKLASVLDHPQADYDLFLLLHRKDANLFDAQEKQARIFLDRCLARDMPECQYEMAKIKLTGDENIRNIEQGLELLRLSASSGYSKADNLLFVISAVTE